jgi:hypothetical protein
MTAALDVRVTPDRRPWPRIVRLPSGEDISDQVLATRDNVRAVSGAQPGDILTLQVMARPPRLVKTHGKRSLSRHRLTVRVREVLGGTERIDDHWMARAAWLRRIVDAGVVADAAQG